jgi:hypothetical protein
MGGMGVGQARAQGVEWAEQGQSQSQGRQSQGTRQGRGGRANNGVGRGQSVCAVQGP